MRFFAFCLLKLNCGGVPVGVSKAGVELRNLLGVPSSRYVKTAPYTLADGWL